MPDPTPQYENRCSSCGSSFIADSKRDPACSECRSPTLAVRLDLAAACGVPMATLKANGFELSAGKIKKWYWMGYSARRTMRSVRGRAAHSALNAVCVEWLGDKEGVAIIPSRGQWAIIGRVPWDIANKHHPTPTAAIHAAMLAVNANNKETAK